MMAVQRCDRHHKCNFVTGEAETKIAVTLNLRQFVR